VLPHPFEAGQGCVFEALQCWPRPQRRSLAPKQETHKSVPNTLVHGAAVWAQPLKRLRPHCAHNNFVSEVGTLPFAWQPFPKCGS
jgi:hypothetical protein